jgi:hypothetical protein
MKLPIRITIAVFLVWLNLTSALAQMSKETLLRNGWEAIHAIRHEAASPIESALAEGPSASSIPLNRRLWLVSAGRDTADVDPITGEVWLVEAGDVQDSLVKDPNGSDAPQNLRSPDDAVERSRALAAALGWNLADRWECKSVFPKLDSNGVGRRAGIQVRFLGMRGGYRSELDDVSFTFDSVSGDVAVANRQVGFTFEKPTLNIDGVSALKIAREAGSGDVKLSIEPQYLTFSLSDPGEIPHKLALTKTAILGYRVEGTERNVFIDGATGEVLLSFSSATGSGDDYLRRLKTDPELQKALRRPAVIRKSHSEPPKPPPQFDWNQPEVYEGVAAVLAAILIPLAWLSWRRFARPRA